MWEQLRIDLVHSYRGLRRSAALAIVAILTIAIALAATTTVASLVNATSLRQLPVRDPEQLVAVSATDVRGNRPGSFYRDTFLAYQSIQHSFSSISMYSGGLLVRVTDAGVSADASLEAVSPEYFRLLGATAAAGSFFDHADGSTAAVAVVTERFHRRFFGSETDAVGRTIEVDGTPLTVVGVTTPGFYGLQFDGGADLVVPIGLLRILHGDARPVHAPYLIGRLVEGATVGQARAELSGRWRAVQESSLPGSVTIDTQRRLEQQHLEVSSLASGFSTLRRQYGSSLVALAGLCSVLLAIACCNLAALMLARALTRRYQTAVRVALGAGRGRIARQVASESILLALAGLLVAVPLAWWATRGMAAMFTVARPTPLLQSVTPTLDVLGFASCLALLIGLAMGVMPAARAFAAAPRDLIGHRTVITSIGRSGRLLLIGEVALSLVLLVVAGLFATSLWRLYEIGGSVHPQDRLLFGRLVRRPGDRIPLTPDYVQSLVKALATASAADSAALSVYYPAFLGFPGPLPLDHYAAGTTRGADVSALTEWVSPGFFETVGISRLQGRDFTWFDDADAPGVAIVNERLARIAFPKSGGVGEPLRLMGGPGGKSLLVVGVAADAPIGRMREPHQPVVFRPILQQLEQAEFPLAHVRVNGAMADARDEIVRIVDSRGRHFVRGVFTYRQWVDFALLQDRMTAGLALFAGALTLILACIGIYSLLSYAVTSRMREIGVRLALGATGGRLVRMVVGQDLWIAGLGLAIGVPCALGAAALIRSRLYEVSPSDPLIIVGACASLLVVATISAFLPARRALKTDPLQALRLE